jgi:hypothetical protein
MKRKTLVPSLRFVITLVLVFGMATLGLQLYAQQTTQPSSQQYPAQQPGQEPAQQPQQQGGQAGQSGQQAPDSQAQPEPSGVQTFTGVIVKSGDKYVLQDSASGSTYDIDRQDQVKQFEGKRVRVHGTLDSSGKMIHVQ